MSSEVSGFLAADWSLRPWSCPLIGWWSWHLGTAGGPETRPKLWRTYSFLATPFHSRILSRPVEMQKLKLQRMRDTKWFWKYKFFFWKDKNFIVYWASEDSPWCPNLTDRLERFFNTSISHFILFWNRIENCHNSVNLGLSRQISLSSTQSLCAWWGLNTTTSRLIGGCEANLIWLASQESVKKWPHNWCLLFFLTFLQNAVKLILSSEIHTRWSSV